MVLDGHKILTIVNTTELTRADQEVSTEIDLEVKLDHLLR